MVMFEYFCRMKRICCVCFLYLTVACNTDPHQAKATPVTGDTAHYYAIADFFREQLAYVDLRNFPIYQINQLNGKKDSVMISKDQFLAWGAAFTAQSVLFQKNKQLYTESVFRDLSTQSYTLTYTSLDPQKTDIQHIDILLNDENHLAKRLFIKKVYMSGDTTVTEQYSWKAYKSFQVTRFKTAGAMFSSSAQSYVNWNDTQ